MSISKKSSPIKLAICALAFGILSISATTATTPKKKKRKSPSAITAKSIELKQSKYKTVDLTTVNGVQVSLPKVEMVFDEEALPITSLGSMMNMAGDYSVDILKERLAENKEMADLSEKLGIEIKDAKYLNLYREVAVWLGTRYRRGGMSHQAVDCSGFTNLIYNNVFEKKLPRVSTEIARTVPEAVDKNDLLPGDLVFFSTLGRKYINHVGVYIGEGNFVHASIKRGVVVSTLLDGYYSKAWRKGGRLGE